MIHKFLLLNSMKLCIIILCMHLYSDEQEEKDMSEKKRFKRIPIDIKLTISDLFKQDNVNIKNIDAPIVVKNISKTGIGFETEAVLPLGYYFNSKIELGNKESSLYSVVQIVRSEERDGKVFYGCQFVGKADILDFIFDEYDEEFEIEE